MNSQPIEHCYWVIPGKLLAGEYPRNLDIDSSIQKVNALLEAGVSAFIDLTEKKEGLLPYSELLKSATHQRFAVRDVSVPESEEVTISILDAIDNHIDQGRIVYVHCWGGVGRTGVIVGCWLVRHGYEGREALARLRELWKQCPKSATRISPESIEQEQYILGWKEAP